MIDFLQAPDGGPVKIGCSNDADRRRQQLESHYGKPLALLRVIDGGRDTEREIHERFAAHRLGRTEQFRPVPDLMEFIGRPLLVGANPDAIEAMAGPGPRRTVLTIKGSEEWRVWLEGLSDFLRTPTSTIVDHALVRYAKDVGFPKEAPKR